MRKTAVDVVKAALERVIRSFEEDARLSEMTDAEFAELARAAIAAHEDHHAQRESFSLHNISTGDPRLD